MIKNLIEFNFKVILICLRDRNSYSFYSFLISVVIMHLFIYYEK